MTTQTEQTVVARDLRSALRQVRERFGPDALILETRTRQRPVAGALRMAEEIEVRVALPGSLERASEPTAPLAAELARLESLLSVVEAELDDRENSRYPLAAPLATLGLLPETLARLAADHAEEVPPVEQAKLGPALDRLAFALPCLEAMAVADLRGYHALLGAPGAGRSALAAKLCARAAAAGASAVHIALAPMHAGERHRLEALAIAGGHEAVLAPDAGALVEALRYLERRDLVIVDMPGFSLDQRALLERAAAQAGVPMLLRHAVLPADGWARFAPGLQEAAHYLAITRTDLADPLRIALDLTQAGAPLLSFVAGGTALGSSLELAQPAGLLAGLRGSLQPARSGVGAGR